MKIQHTIERTRKDGRPGTVIDMPPTEASPDGSTYVFEPAGNDPRHVAEVTDPAHAARFLKIQSFAAIEHGVVTTNTLGSAPATPAAAEANTGQAHAKSEGETNVETNDAPETVESASTKPGVATLSDEALAKLHTDLFGKAPRANAGRYTIISKIEAKMAETH